MSIRQTRYGRECDRDWGSMELQNGEKYCTDCNKCVKDFTHWDRDAIKTWYASHPETCGYFKREDIEYDMIPLERVFPFRRWAMLILGALFTGAGLSAQSINDTTETETVQEPVQQIPVVIPNRHTDSTRHEATGLNDEKQIKTVAVRKPPGKIRKRYYLSWRFPFLHKRRAHRKLMGCPVF